MYDLIALEATVRDKICRQYGFTDDRGIHGDEGPGSCPALWVLHDLVGLLAEYHDRPARELGPMVRQLIVEQKFVDDNGDSVFEPCTRAEIDRHVSQITDILESVRREAYQQGFWVELPATPLMCG
jgi:hypothetical protein